MTDRPDPLERITFRGRTMDRKTAAALAVAEQRLGYDLTVAQGAYNPGGVGASGGTHDKGGVVDLSAWDRKRKVKVLRDLGFAAWYRPAIAGLWGPHIHAVMIGHQDLAPAAVNQVAAYKAGLDGLKGGRRDPNPYRPNVQPFSYAAAWRDDLLRSRNTGLRARVKALRDRMAANRAAITYK